jgi:uncharacterized membrane protein
MIGLERPELLLLLLPAVWLAWRVRDGAAGTNLLRALALLLLGLALAGAYLDLSSPGRDLVVVVDRSSSMTDEARQATLEQLRLAEAQRGPGDRVAVVTFGATVAVERGPSEAALFEEFVRPVEPDGSDLAGALEAALELVPEGRAGSILLLSDGEVRGRDPLPAARRAFARGVHIDVRPFPREGSGDLAVERLDLPGLAAAGEPFQFSAWVRSDRTVEARYELLRGEEVIARGERTFRPGANRLVFRDAVDRQGIARYTLRLDSEPDRIPENDRGIGALRIEGPRRLLVVNHDGAEDSLVRALRRSGLAVDVAPPESAPLDRIGLEAYRAVVLENVEAGRVGSRMVDLRRFVTERGGGLMLTGGRASFGVGGYHLSPLDPVLPVSMELRKEQREQGIALAIALDRSGSMGAEVTGGTKMELANAGAAAAISLLVDIDSVAVLAVDTSADVVQSMSPVDDLSVITGRVLRITSGGGGIFVREAMERAALELSEAPQLSKHLTLFADAADAEQQEGCIELAGELLGAGVTTSVIALGTPGDPDAGFLEALAEAGGGECYFTVEADELPRLFAQDTLNATRSAFVDQPVGVTVLADLFALGELPSRTFPDLGGYNLTYLRPGATAGLTTTDDTRAPVFAFQQRGLGRAAAFTGQVGGTHGGGLVAWEGFSAWFVTAARWLLGDEPPEEVFGTVRREGREAVIEVELEPDSPVAADLTGLEALLGEEEAVQRRPMTRVAADRYQARFPLEAEGIALPAVRLDDRRSLRLAPLALPYSPEFEPRADARSGERTLRALASESGGEVSPPTTTLFRGLREGRAWRPIARELALAALVVLILEILARRLSLWDLLLRRRSDEAAPEADTEATRAARRAHAAQVEAAPRPSTPEHPGVPAAGHATLADAMRRARGRARGELDR